MTMERMKLAKGFFDTETNLEYSGVILQIVNRKETLRFYDAGHIV